MKLRTLALLTATALYGAALLAADALIKTESAKPVALAANGMVIPDPTSTNTYSIKDGDSTIAVPEGMVYVPAGKFAFGEGAAAKEVELEGFFLGRFEVTNAEWEKFLDATGRRAPRYWKDGHYPAGKANHPVLFVSLTEVEAYCAWISKATGWKVFVPTAEQWEKAARGPKGGRYPWGNEKGVSYENGKLATRFNYNAVCAAHFLEKTNAVTTYSERSTRKGESVAVKDISDGQHTFGISRDGNVAGWINHQDNTGFVGTTLYHELVDNGGFTMPVGSYEAGKSWCGAYDLAGNAYEWTSSLITASNGAEKGRLVNDVRGDSWYSNGRSCTSLCTGEGRVANTGYHSVGFRIAMSPMPKYL